MPTTAAARRRAPVIDVGAHVSKLCDADDLAFELLGRGILTPDEERIAAARIAIAAAAVRRARKIDAGDGGGLPPQRRGRQGIERAVAMRARRLLAAGRTVDDVAAELELQPYTVRKIRDGEHSALNSDVRRCDGCGGLVEGDVCRLCASRGA